MKLWWYSAANILYAFGSLSYFIVNLVNLIDRTTIQSSITYGIFIVLAAIFVLDALLYTVDWFKQRLQKQRRELCSCLLNVAGSILYLVGTTVLQNKKISSADLSDIPAFICNLIGMVAFLAESILCFFLPRVSRQTSKCSVEFFAHLLNFFGNFTYLTAHIVQPVLALIATYTSQFLTKINDFLFLIILPIQIFGDVIYTIDAVLYIIVWLKANEQMRKIAVVWIERDSRMINARMKTEPLEEETLEFRVSRLPLQRLNIRRRSPPPNKLTLKIPDTIIEDGESSNVNRSNIERTASSTRIE